MEFTFKVKDAFGDMFNYDYDVHVMDIFEILLDDALGETDLDTLNNFIELYLYDCEYVDDIRADYLVHSHNGEKKLDIIKFLIEEGGVSILDLDGDIEGIVQYEFGDLAQDSFDNDNDCPTDLDMFGMWER